MKKLHLGLLLCMSLSYSLKAGDITKAIRDLNVAQVEKKLEEYGQLDPNYRLKLIDTINKKIRELQKQQNSLSKYVNPQTILGILGAGLTKYYFDRTTSEQTINHYSDLNQREIRQLDSIIDRNATNIIDRMAEHASQWNFGRILDEPQRGFNRITTDVQNFVRRHNKNAWICASLHGALTTACALASLKQLYDGLTTKNLKNNYAKALAIKALLQQTPTNAH